MERNFDRYKAGLVFLEMKPTDPIKLMQSMARQLEARGHRVTGIRARSDSEAEISVDGSVLNLAVYRNIPGAGHERADSFSRMPQIGDDFECDFSDARMVIQVTVDVLRSASEEIREPARELMCFAAYSLADELEADFIHWREPNEELNADHFVDAYFDKPKVVAVTPIQAHVAAAAVLANPANLARVPEVALNTRPIRESHQVAEGDTDDLMRLATWMLTFTVALFALPVAAALFIMNLLRGEDMRLAAHSLALTGFMITLANTASAQAVLAAFGG